MFDPDKPIVFDSEADVEALLHALEESAKHPHRIARQASELPCGLCGKISSVSLSPIRSWEDGRIVSIFCPDCAPIQLRKILGEEGHAHDHKKQSSSL